MERPQVGTDRTDLYRGSGKLGTGKDYLMNDPASYYYEKYKLGNNQYFSNKWWTEAATRGESLQLASLLEQRAALDNLNNTIAESNAETQAPTPSATITSPTSETTNVVANEDKSDTEKYWDTAKYWELYKTYEDRLGYDEYMMALNMPNYDNTTPRERIDPVTERSYGKYTDREWAKLILDSSFGKAKAEIDKEEQENRSVFEKFGVALGAAITHVAANITKFIGDVGNFIDAIISSSWITPIINFVAGHEYEDPATRFVKAFSKTNELDKAADRMMAAAYALEYDYLPHIVNPVEAYEAGYDRENWQNGPGIYTKSSLTGIPWATWITSALDSIGYMLPSIALNFFTGGATLPALIGKEGMKVSGAAFYAGIFSGNMKETLNKAALYGKSYKDLNPWEVTANAAVRATLEYAIEEGLAKALQLLPGGRGASKLDILQGTTKTGTALTEISAKTIGKTEGAAFARYIWNVTRDGLKEGLEEVSQDLSNSFINYITTGFGGGVIRDENGEPLTDANGNQLSLYDYDISAEDLIASFMAAFITTYMTSSAEVVTKLISDDRVVFTSEEGQWKGGLFQTLNFNDAIRTMSEWNKLMQDNNIPDQKRAQAAYKMNMAVNALGGMFKVFDDNTIAKITTILSAYSNDVKFKEAQMSKSNLDFSKNLFTDFIAKYNANAAYVSLAERAGANLRLKNKEQQIAEIQRVTDKIIAEVDRTKEVAEKLKAGGVTNIGMIYSDGNIYAYNLSQEELDKVKKSASYLKDYILIGADGNVITKAGDDIIIAPQRLIVDGKVDEILQGISFETVKSAVLANLSQAQKNMILSSYQKITNDSNATMEDALKVFLFSPEFYTKILLLSGERGYSVEAIKAITTIDQILKDRLKQKAKYKSVEDNAVDTLLRKVRETMRVGIVNYATHYQYLDIDNISDEILPADVKKDIRENKSVLVNAIIQNASIQAMLPEAQYTRYDMLIDRLGRDLEPVDRDALKADYRKTGLPRIQADMALGLLLKIFEGHTYTTSYSGSKLVYLPADVSTKAVTGYLSNFQAFAGVSLQDILNNNNLEQLSQNAQKIIQAKGYDLNTIEGRSALCREILRGASMNTLTLSDQGTILQVIQAQNFLKDKFLDNKALMTYIKEASKEKRVVKLKELVQSGIEVANINIIYDPAISDAGLSTGNTIYLNDTSDVNTICHEVTHIYQNILARQILQKTDLSKDTFTYTMGATLAEFEGMIPSEKARLTKYLNKNFPIIMKLMKAQGVKNVTNITAYSLVNGEIQANAKLVTDMFDVGFRYEDDRSILVSPDGKERFKLANEQNTQMQNAIKADNELNNQTNNLINDAAESQQLTGDKLRKELFELRDSGWNKTASSILKNDNNTPKVFYRGTNQEEFQLVGKTYALHQQGAQQVYGEVSKTIYRGMADLSDSPQLGKYFTFSDYDRFGLSKHKSTLSGTLAQYVLNLTDTEVLKINMSSEYGPRPTKWSIPVSVREQRHLPDGSDQFIKPYNDYASDDFLASYIRDSQTKGYLINPYTITEYELKDIVTKTYDMTEFISQAQESQVSWKDAKAIALVNAMDVSEEPDGVLILKVFNLEELIQTNKAKQLSLPDFSKFETMLGAYLYPHNYAPQTKVYEDSENLEGPTRTTNMSEYLEILDVFSEWYNNYITNKTNRGFDSYLSTKYPTQYESIKTGLLFNLATDHNYFANLENLVSYYRTGNLDNPNVLASANFLLNKYTVSQIDQIHKLLQLKIESDYADAIKFWHLPSTATRKAFLEFEPTKYHGRDLFAQFLADKKGNLQISVIPNFGFKTYNTISRMEDIELKDIQVAMEDNMPNDILVSKELLSSDYSKTKGHKYFEELQKLLLDRRGFENQSQDIQNLTETNTSQFGTMTSSNQEANQAYNQLTDNAKVLLSDEAQDVPLTPREEYALQLVDALDIRQLTPNEEFRLMGVKDVDFKRIAEHQTRNSLYHLAGDSIVTNVLTAIFDKLYNDKIIVNPVRLIEFFAGYGAQNFGLEYSSNKIKYEPWKIAEWAVKSIQAYKDAHHYNDNTDYAKDMTKPALIDALLSLGVSRNYNEPASRASLNMLSLGELKAIYNNIKITNNLVDITKVTGESLDITDTDKYDYLLTYSFPCQDLSRAGKRKGMSIETQVIEALAEEERTRSSMLWEVDRILKELKDSGKSMPKILIMENVPEVNYSKNKAEFEKWRNNLESYGYTNSFQNLKASDYGVPQGRIRTFMVSIYGDTKFEFPKAQQSDLTVQDLLDKNVSEEYYLRNSESRVKRFAGHSPTFANNVTKNPINQTISPTLTTTISKRAQGGNYISDKAGVDINLQRLLHPQTATEFKATKKALAYIKAGNKLTNDIIDKLYNDSSQDIKFGDKSLDDTESYSFSRTLNTNVSTKGLKVTKMSSAAETQNTKKSLSAAERERNKKAQEAAKKAQLASRRWRFKKVFVPNETAKLSNMKYWIHQGKPIYVSQGVLNFVNATTDKRIYDELPIEIKKLIYMAAYKELRGTLTLQKIRDFIATTDNLNKTTREYIARYAYNNNELATLSDNEYNSLFDDELLTGIAAISYLVYELKKEIYNKFDGPALQTIRDIDIKDSMSLESLKMLREKIFELAQENKFIADIYNQSVDILSEQLTGGRHENIRQLLPQLLFRLYDGTITSFRSIVNYLAKALDSDTHWTLKSLDKMATYETLKVAEDVSDLQKISELTEYYKDRLVEKIKAMSFNEQLDWIAKLLKIPESAKQSFVENAKSNPRQATANLRNAIQIDVSDKINKFDRLNSEQLNKLYVAKIIGETIQQDLSVEQLMEEVKAEPRTRKNVRENIKNMLNTTVKYLTKKSEYDAMPDQVKDFIEWKGSKPKFIAVDWSKYSLEQLNDIESIVRGTRDVLAEAKQEEQEKLRLKKKMTETERERLKRVANEQAIEARRLLAEQEILEKEKRSLDERLAKANVFVAGNVVGEQEAPKTKLVNKILSTEFEKNRMTEVQVVVGNEEKNIVNIKSFYARNAEAIMDASMSLAEMEDTINWFLNAQVKMYDKNNKQINSLTDYTNFYAVKLAFLALVNGESGPKGIYRNINPNLKQRIDKEITAIASMSGTNLSIWKSLIPKADPLKAMASASLTIDGVELPLDLKEHLFGAVQSLDPLKIQDMINQSISFVEKNKTEKKPFLDKLIAFRSMSMLSNPLTWLRNIMSNLAVTSINNLASRIGNKVWSSKTSDVVKQIKFTAEVTPEIRDFIKEQLLTEVEVEFNGKKTKSTLFDTLVSSMSKYNPSDIKRDKSGVPYEDETKKEAILGKMVLKSLYSQYYHNNVFDNKMLNSLYQHLMKVMSDDRFVRKAAIKYFGKIIAEKQYSLKEGMTDKMAQDFASAVGLALADYMHSDNFFNDLEKSIRERSTAGWFLYKQILPFAAASWNWFKAAYKLTPVGLIHSLVRFAKLEDSIRKVDARWQEGKSQLDPRFVEYKIRRDIGAGIIGSVSMLLGLLLGAIGIIRIKDDDGIPKVTIGPLNIDIHSIFGHSSILAGAAIMSGIKDDGDFWQGLNKMGNVLLDDMPLMDILQMDMYHSNAADWILDYLQSASLSYIPNFVSYIAGATYSGKAQLSSNSWLAWIQRAGMKIPLLNTALTEFGAIPRKIDPYTGKVKDGEYWKSFVNRIVPYVSIKVASYNERKTAELGLNKTMLRGQYTINGKSFKVSGSTLEELNKLYGSWNAKDLTDFYANKTKVKVKVGNAYQTLSYNQMTDEQRKYAVNTLMSNNAELVKIKAWTDAGNKYYTSEETYKKLKAKGIKNIYVGNRGFVAK